MTTPRYEIVGGTLDDVSSLYELSRFLDSVNLPHDEAALRELLDLSEKSYSGAIRDPRRREYVFILRDLQTGRAAGTSMIIGQLGRRDAPYIYVDVLTEEKYSATLDKHFVHQVLSIGYSFNGPTEIGGLVMHPDYRRVPERLGMLISYVRFLFIAIHREDFQSELLAELLPPLESDGTSHLWEAVGRHFTDLSYRDADRLSKRNKEFIRALWPEGDIYVSLLPKAAQDVVGVVGPQTRGVEKLLRRIGFRYADRVDPFDGGPHFVAAADEVSLIRRVCVSHIQIGELHCGKPALVAIQPPNAPFFRAIPTRVEFSEHFVRICAGAARHLALSDGDEVSCLPLE